MEKTVTDTEIRLASKDDLWQIRELALVIFPYTYEKIVEADQIDYMMELFYTPAALLSQLSSGQIFLIIYYEGRAAGYASYSRLNIAGAFRLNKIYLDYHLQGKGLGRILLNDIISRVRAADGKSLRLNVNRHNKATGFYFNLGFHVVREEMLDIGGGHFMDDYEMEIKLG